MATNAPEIDTTVREAPTAGDRPQPDLATTAIAWVQLGSLGVGVNLLVLGLAGAAGAQMTVNAGLFTQAIGPVAVLGVTLGAVLVAAFAWSLVAHRAPAFAHLWVPLVWGVGLLSLGGTLGASGLSTGIALALMHVLTTAIAAHLIPRRLPR